MIITHRQAMKMNAKATTVNTQQKAEGLSMFLHGKVLSSYKTAIDRGEEATKALIKFAEKKYNVMA